MKRNIFLIIFLIIVGGCAVSGHSDSNSQSQSETNSSNEAIGDNSVDETLPQELSDQGESLAQDSSGDIVVFLPNNTLTLNYANEIKSFDVMLIDDNKLGVDGSIDIGRLYDENQTYYGDFDSYSLTTTNAKATLKFIAPPNEPSLKSKTVDIIADINGNKTTKTITIKYDYNTSSISTYQRYTIYSTMLDSMNLQELKQFHFYVADINDKNSKAQEDNISNLSISILTPTIAKIADEDGVEKNSISVSKKNSKYIYIQTYTKSGVGAIEVNATINGESVSKIFTFTILSGKISSLSLAYISSSYSDGLFKDRFVVHAVDRYGNRANDGDHIFAGVVVGVDLNGTDGIIESGTNGAKFTSNSITSNRISTEDTLIILPTKNQNRYEYIGGWEIDSIDSNILNLRDSFNYDKNSSLKFVLGKEYRLNPYEYAHANAVVNEESKEYKISNGVAYVDIEYVPYLVGKDIYLYVNSYNDNKIGTTYKKTLYGTGITATGEEVYEPQTEGQTFSVNVVLTQNDSNQYLQDVSSTLLFDGNCTDKNQRLISKKDFNITDNGSMQTEVTVPKDGKCSVSWSGFVKEIY